MPRGRPHNISECQSCHRVRRHYAKGFCASCYTRNRHAHAVGVPCRRCERARPHFSLGLCRSCYHTSVKLRKKYGITFEYYDLLLKIQGGRCSICERPFGNKKPHVDHCHSTGMVRGLLCYTCNVGLGSFSDDPERLRSAARYVEANRARKIA